MSTTSKCPQCGSINIYQDGNLWTCPECFHEWMESSVAVTSTDDLKQAGIKDANGTLLTDGDAVIVVKDLKIKGSSTVVKGGTKVKNIRLTDAGDGHDITCKIDGLGIINLKSEFVRKA